MEVMLSEIQIIPIKPRNGLIAFCSFVINDSFYVGDIAIYSRLDGSNPRLVYPSRCLPNGATINCFHPINRRIGQLIERQVSDTFLELMEKVKKTEGERNGTSYRLPSH